jgi:hypothetical protein
MFRHLRAILRERLCPREYVKTKAAMYGLSYHVLTRTKTLREDGTYVPKHVGAALVIKILTKLSAQCWFL